MLNAQGRKKTIAVLVSRVDRSVEWLKSASEAMGRLSCRLSQAGEDCDFEKIFFYNLCATAHATSLFAILFALVF